MKQQFQQENPSINVTILMNQTYDCYNLTSLPKIFSKDGPQLVEADLSLLGYLVDHGYIEPYQNTSLEQNIRPQALPAGQYHDQTYAIPTWICSQFLFSRDPSIMEIHNLSDLSSNFQAHSLEYSLMLTSDFQGGGIWMLPMLYVFSYTDNRGYAKKTEAISSPVNETDIGTMTETMDWCSEDGINNCLNGYYSTHSPIKVFAKNESYSYNGFSENLYNIRRTDLNATLYIISTPFGTEQNPLIWVDGLVINQNACDNDQCMEAASKFVSYYNSIQAKDLIAFSEDAYTPAPPRYILPATQDFYQSIKVVNDRYYQEFEHAIDTAESFPNSGIVNTIRQRYPDICDRIKRLVPDTQCICETDYFANPKVHE